MYQIHVNALSGEKKTQLQCRRLMISEWPEEQPAQTEYQQVRADTASLKKALLRAAETDSEIQKRER